ncbi:hypothetical protein [Streptomyces sp. NPDC018610]|uniref:hypothetical protein n=1 Tax=Streptomyces sp. NPDC018610 TaxID=3365049 RepID=UPI00378ADF1C
MTSAEHALNAVEPESAVRVDEGMETTLARALERTFPTKGGRPHAFVVVCRSPAAGRSVTLTLERGEEGSDYEVTCGDREADRFEVPAGSPFTVRVVPDRRDADVMVLWRVETVGSDDVSDCGDDIEGCEA